MKFIFALLLAVGLVAAGPLNNSKKHNNFGVDFDALSEGRIVGGVAATAGQAPYQVSLLYGGRHFCGGTIVSARWIITAAHCVDGTSVSQISIRYNTLTQGSGGQVIKSKTIIKHQDYNSNTIDNDIAAIELAEAMTLGQTNAQLVPVVESGSDPASGADAIISGWGALKEGGSSPSALQIVTVPIVGRDQCNANYGAGMITDGMFCAGVSGGGKDACQGDSGGPVIVGGKLAGAVSWGYGCARPNYPGVYARVGKYVPWLQQHNVEFTQ